MSKQKCCPLCNQEMDFCCSSFRNHQFIDGKTYKLICFGCAHTPEDFVHKYTADGSVDTEEGPFFDHKHLRTPEDLFNIGSVATLDAGKRCVRGVRRAISEVGTVALNKLKLTRPLYQYVDLDHGDEDDYDEEEGHPKKKRRFGKSAKVKTPKEPTSKKGPMPPEVKDVIVKAMSGKVSFKAAKKKFTASKKRKG